VCCLLHVPKVLLLDEPLNGLDVLAVQKLRQELRRMSENGAAILYCSHLLDVVERLCDKTIILINGSIVANDTTENLIQQSADGTLESAFRSLSSSTESDLRDSGTRD
jgi:ABC-2 type transport system ATP-binding protein